MISSRRTLSWTNVLGSQLATTAGKRAQARQKIQHMQMDGTSFPGSAVREGWSWDRNVAQHFACMHCWERCKYELARRRQASEMENAAKWRINAAARALHTKLVRRQCQCRIYSRRRQLLELVLIKLEASVGYCVCWLVGWLIDWLTIVGRPMRQHRIWASCMRFVRQELAEYPILVASLLFRLSLFDFCSVWLLLCSCRLFNPYFVCVLLFQSWLRLLGSVWTPLHLSFCVCSW